MRLTKEREAEIRAHAEVDGCDGVDDLLAELDAVRAEREEWHDLYNAAQDIAQKAEAELDAARADERAKVVEWLREHVEERCAAFAADAIERGEHVPEAQR